MYFVTPLYSRPLKSFPFHMEKDRELWARVFHEPDLTIELKISAHTSLARTQSCGHT